MRQRLLLSRQAETCQPWDLSCAITIEVWVGRTGQMSPRQTTQLFHPLQMHHCSMVELNALLASPFILLGDTLPMKVRACGLCRPNVKGIKKWYSHKLSLDFMSCGPFRSGQKLKSMVVQIIIDSTKSLLKRLF